MKIFHISDLHIGKHLHMHNMAQDQAYILHEIVEKAKEYRPDVILVAGDVYDKSIPSGEAYRLFDTFLDELAQIEPVIPVLIIAGNHDHAERLQYASGFMEKHHIYISVMPPQREDEYLKKITLTDEYGEVDFYLLPFTKPGYVRGLLSNGQELTYERAYAGILEREQIDENRRNVLVAHQFFVTQGQKTETCDSEQLSLLVGGIDAIDTSVVSQFDYVAAGHIHGPQNLAQGKVRYCGTPLKYSVSEEKHHKSITMITLQEKGIEPILETIPLQPLREVRRIKGTLAELLSQAEGKQEDYVSITLTDEKEPYRPKDSLDEVYTHILEITLDNSRTRAIRQSIYEQGEEAQIQKSPLEEFRDFYEMMQQQPLSELEEQALTEIMEQLGGDLT